MIGLAGALTLQIFDTAGMAPALQFNAAMPPNKMSTPGRVLAATLLLVAAMLPGGCGPDDAGLPSDWVESRTQQAVISMASAMSYARKAGMPCNGNLIIAGAVARGESGLNYSAVGGPNYNGSYDYGLWQINNKAHPQYSKSCLLSPSCNAKAMMGVSSGGKNWKPWVVYWKGYYKKYMATAQAAYPSVCAPPNKAPVGYLDGTNSACEAVYGWAQDPDSPHKALSVHVYFNGPAGAKGAHGVNGGKANVYRSDLCKAIKSCKHGFSVPIPVGLRDNKTRKAYAYTFDAKTGKPTALKNHPKTFKCKPPPPPLGPSKAQKRWVVNPTSFSRWKMSYMKVFHVTTAQAKAYSTGKPMPSTPVLVLATGAPEVWLLDSGTRRHVLNPASMSAWGFSFSQIKKWSKAQVNLYPKGRHWPARRTTLLAPGGGVYVLDSLPPAVGPKPADKGTKPADKGTKPADKGTKPAAADAGQADLAPSSQADAGLPTLLDGQPVRGDGMVLQALPLRESDLQGSCSAGGAPGGGVVLLLGLVLLLALGRSRAKGSSP